MGIGKTFMNRESVIEFLPQATPPKAWSDVEESVVGLPDAVGGDMSRTTSGATPLLGRDVAPSRPGQTHLPEPTAPLFRRKCEVAVEDALTPRPSSARDRATDLMKATVPLPLMAALIASAVTIAAAMWRIESQIDLINERIAHNRELIELKEKALEDRFKMLEAKIETAGLRNSAMLLSQELAKKER